jgi:AcrR family transcriptional regulator
VRIPARIKSGGASRSTSRSIKNRLTDALSTLASATPPTAQRITVSSLCREAGVSRNTVYRYYPDVAEAARRLNRRRGPHRRLAQQSTLRALRAELAALRVQLAKLATLVDHYHTEAEELRVLLARRDRDRTKAGHGRGDPTVVSIHRSGRRAPDSRGRGS